MKNLLKSDFYRLFKSLSFYICTAVSLLLFGSGIFLMDWANKMAESQGNSFPLPYKDGLSYGITAFMDSSVLMLIGIFTAIFVAAEFSHGTMKNLVSKGFSRQNIFLSKLVTMTTAAFIMVLATVVAGVAAGTIVTGAFGSLSGDFGGYILKTLGIELLLYIALTALLVMVAMIVRNLGGVIAVDLIGVLTFESVMFAALEFLTKSKIKFSEFSLLYNISFYRMKMDAVGSDYIRSAIVAAVFLAAVTAFGIFMFRKTDVK